MIWTPSQAWQYVQDKISDFYKKGTTLRGQYDAALSLDNAYANHSMDRTEIRNLIRSIETDLADWRSIDNKLSPILSYFGYDTGMGFNPVAFAVIGVTVIAVATMLYLFYQSNKIDQHSAAIKIIASKVPLSPEEQTVIDQAASSGFFGNLFSGIGGLGSTVLLIVGGLIIYNLTKRN